MKVKFWPRELNFKMNKSPVPIIFLDSNTLIEFIKIESGKSDDQKIKKLFELLKELKDKDIIMCPIAEQEEEIGYQKNKDNIDLLFKLSNGNRFKHSLEIEKEQKERFFQKFLLNDKNIELDYREGFETIDNKTADQKYFIKNILNCFGENIIKDLQAEKINLTNELNDYKNELNPKESFKIHLFRGLTYEGVKLSRKVLGKINKEEELTSDESEFWVDFLFLSKKYKLKGDLTKQFIEYTKFLISSYWVEIPCVDIYRKILTYISLSQINSKFKNGDFKDCINASSFLPYVNVYYTDNSMCNIIKELNIDEFYNTSVFCYKTINKLINYLELLKD